jgi:hypothetical protein
LGAKAFGITLLIDFIQTFKGLEKDELEKRLDEERDAQVGEEEEDDDDDELEHS